MIENTVKQVSSNNLFASLSHSEYAELAQMNHVIEVKKGNYVYFDPQYLNKVFILAEGIIKIGHIDNNGNEIVKEIIMPGGLFGQCTLETKDMNGEFALAYKSNVRLSVFTIENFKKVLQKNTTVAISYSQKMATQFRKAENRLVSMLYSDVKTRLMRFFCEMILSHTNPPAENTLMVDNFLTHDDIAKLIGSTRQTVTSCFNDPDIQRRLRITRKHIIITDINGIRRLAGY
jgi:CRP/FNR family transcriptional regulator